MNIYLKKHNGALVPADKTAQDHIDELRGNTWYKCSVKKSRNGKLHCKLFAFFSYVFDNSDFYTGWTKSAAMDNLLDRAKFGTGHYETYKIGDVSLAKTKSISYEKMDNLKFEEFYMGAVAAILRDEELGITEIGDF